MKILYICTHNRCRSILSEAITNHLAGDLITARSAGSQPAGEVHPQTLRSLQASGISTAELQSRSWDEFEDFAPDLVITVCDSAAGESCPLWMGNTIKLHWGLADPSKVTGSDAHINAAFGDCMAKITQRVLLMRDQLEAGADKAGLLAAISAQGAQ
ncbi:arsenate reductase ArsC [Alteromonas sp. CYL-A6]|uniref:arsenate reductase ArsC n=1 Tax=Alteromonas nitratireducens TaxID=3390813 RepID=UPI0034A9DCBF